MTVDRRGFLKLAGCASVLGIGGAKVVTAMAASDSGTYGEPHHASTAKRWAMVVEVQKCLKKDGCTVCIDACHTAHNVPDFGNPKDEVKWIWREQFHHAFPEQHGLTVPHEVEEAEFPVLCNHCDNPPCVRVCPTQTTFKRDDGIVVMDMHRCIGCRYCIAACPYGSRSFNWRDPRGVDENGKPWIDQITPDYPTRTRGVVEKCNFCSERLAQGLSPACVEACPGKAMHFGDLEDPESDVRHLLEEQFAIRRKPALETQPQVYYLA
jgi:molybdopterin-containing oxidoreductase family iron-sulfur binding subunit